MAIKRFLQVCCIVNDVEKTKQVLRDEYGFTNWAPKEDFGGPVTDYTINGQPAELNNKAEFCTAFGMFSSLRKAGLHGADGQTQSDAPV